MKVINASPEAVIEALYSHAGRMHKAMRRRTNRQWFRDLWDSQASEREFYELAVAIDPALTFEVFDEGWQYRTVLASDIQQAVNEFVQILIGWW